MKGGGYLTIPRHEWRKYVGEALVVKSRMGRLLILCTLTCEVMIAGCLQKKSFFINL